MSDLIKALQIFLKYGNPSRPTHCEHDVFMVLEIDPEDVSEEDIEELEKLSFSVGDPQGCGEECFYSFRFGSC